MENVWAASAITPMSTRQVRMRVSSSSGVSKGGVWWATVTVMSAALVGEGVKVTLAGSPCSTTQWSFTSSCRHSA